MSEIGIFTEEFSTRLDLNRQQKVSKLRGRVMEGAHVGKLAAPIQYLAAYQSSRPNTLYGPLDGTPNTYQRRWVSPTDYFINPMFDTFEQLRTTLDPKGMAPSNIAASFNRDIDDLLIGAAFATATISPSSTTTDGLTTTTESFDTSTYGISEKFGNGTTAIGLTVDKLREAMRIFTHQHVEEEMKTLIVGSQQIDDLLGQVQVVSTEFNSRPELVEGKPTYFMGFQIVSSERLLYGTGIGSSSNTRKCIAFVQSGMYLGVWEDQRIKVDQRMDRVGQPWQFYAQHTHGATRLEPGRLLRIDCSPDTTGADINP